MARRDDEVALGRGAGRNVERQHLKLIADGVVAVGNHVAADAAQEIEKNGCLFVAVGVQTDAALLLKDAAVVTEREKRVPGEIALELPSHTPSYVA